MAPFVQAKSESELKSRVDKFWLRYALHWFNWLDYFVLVAAIQFTQAKTGSITLFVIMVISYMALSGYFVGQFFRLQFHVPGIRSERIKNGISVLLSLMLGLITYLLVAIVIQEISRNM